MADAAANKADDAAAILDEDNNDTDGQYVTALRAKTDLTEAAVARVSDQRARVEKLMEAKATQEAEIAALEERRETANTNWETKKTEQKAAQEVVRGHRQEIGDVAAAAADPVY